MQGSYFYNALLRFLFPSQTIEIMHLLCFPSKFGPIHYLINRDKEKTVHNSHIVCSANSNTSFCRVSCLSFSRSCKKSWCSCSRLAGDFSGKRAISKATYSSWVCPIRSKNPTEFHVSRKSSHQVSIGVIWSFIVLLSLDSLFCQKYFCRHNTLLYIFSFHCKESLSKKASSACQKGIKRIYCRHR